MGVALAFSLASIIILLGVVANHLSRRAAIPDIPLLILLGVLIGPVTGVVTPASLWFIAPIFAALAITVILFEGGLHINITRAVSQSGRALVLAVAGFAFSVLVVGPLASYLLGWPLQLGLLLGSILGGSSSIIVFTLVRRAGTTDRVEALLSLESAFTDIFVVVVSMSLIQLFTHPVEASPFNIATGIFWGFTFGTVIGMLAGILWMWVLDRLWNEANNDIATLGVLLGTFAFTESLGGSGAMSALMFGLILGNSSQIFGMVGVGGDIPAERVMKRFHQQISFMLRTFFFVYLGVIFNPSNLYLFVPGMAITLLLLATRYVAVQIACLGDDILRMDSGVMTVIFPRGLAAAVLAQGVAHAGLPVAKEMVDVVLAIIVVSVLVSSFAVGWVGAGSNRWLGRVRVKDGVSADPKGGDAAAKRRAYEMWFRKSLVDCVLKDLPRGDAWLVDDFSVGGYTPTLCLETHGGMALYEAVAGFEHLKLLPGRIRELQLGGYRGELRVVVDMPTAYRYLSRLVAMEEFCDRVREALGFAVHFYTLDMRRRRLLPLREVREALKPRRRGGAERVLDLVKRASLRLLMKAANRVSHTKPLGRVE